MPVPEQVRPATCPPPTWLLIFLILLCISLPTAQPIQALTCESFPQYATATRAWSFPKAVPPLDRQASVPASERPDLVSPLIDPGWDFTASTRTHPEEGGQHLWPDIAVGPGGLVAVAWMDDHAAGGYGIFYSTTSDGGVTWSMAERVDTRVTGSYSKFVDMEFTPSGIPVLVWEDDREGVYNVYLSKRDPGAGGTPWTANRKLNTTGSPPSAADFMDPSIAVLDDARYFVAWTDWREGVFHQVYGRASRDGGVTWGTESRISDGLGYQPVAGAPCLVVDPTSGLPGQEILYCVTNDWRGNVPGGRYPNVYFYRSTDGGATWTIGVQVNDIEPLYQQVSSHALVRLLDGTLTAGWLNNPGTGSHLRTSVSTDQGATWNASAQVDPSGTGTYSSIVAIDNWVFAAFQVSETSWNSYFRASEDGGRTWTEEACRMDDDPGENAVANPVIAAISPVEVHAAWSDSRPPGTAWKIYASEGDRRVTGIDSPPAPAGLPRGLSLVCTPNPSAPGIPVRIRISAPASGRPLIRALHIYDARGRCLRSLSAGGSDVIWDGMDRLGRPVTPGIYWVRVSAEAGIAVPDRIARLP